MEKQTCGYSGCQNPAAYILKQKVGLKQELSVCAECAPEWVTNGSGSIYYTVKQA